LAVVVVATAAALEAATRALGLAQGLPAQHADNVRDRFLPYRKRPDSVLRGRSLSDEFDFEYRHNGDGFRDRDRPVEKAPGVFRIAALGDSFTYGEGASFDETWVSGLERRLQARSSGGESLEVLRLGLPRYFPGAERLVLEHYGLRYAPDLVLVAVLPNDVMDTHLGIEAIQVDERGFLRTREGQRLGPLAGWLFEHSHVMRIVLRRGLEWLQQRRDPARFEDVYVEGGRLEGDWRRLEDDLDAMLDMSRASGIAFALVSIPQQGPWTDAQRNPDRRLAAWAERRNVPFVPTLDAFVSASGGPPLFYPIDGHCTPAGYDVIAGEVARSLVERHLVP
jgi:lysophospholipase L1-like esterase